MYLRRVYLPLDDVEDRHVDALLGGAGDHDVIRLQEAPHDVEHCCFSNGGFLGK